MALARSSMANKMAMRSPLRAGRVARSAVRVSAKAGNWLPGSDQPAWLPEDLPATYGFDPLSLAKEPASLARFTESEIIHSRWAMLGAAGVLGVELLGQGNWYDVQSAVLNGGKITYLGVPNPLDLNTLLLVEFLGFAVSETLRGGNTDLETKKYPGGTFDFAGLAKSKDYEVYKVKEIKNGRLAMLANLGFLAQHAATGKTPLAALADHLASPFTNNFSTNGVSIPF